MTAVHPELEIEQAVVERAYTLMGKGLADAERSMGEYQTLHRSTAQAIQRALDILRRYQAAGLRKDGPRRRDPLHRPGPGRIRRRSDRGEDQGEHRLRRQ